MNLVDVIAVGREGLWTVLLVAAPVMLAGLAVGLVIALFQALTTIQEMTLTFVPKILMIFISLVIFMPFMANTMIEFGRRLFDRMIALG